MVRTELDNLEDIPNVGPATKQDLALLGIHRPVDLVDKDPYELFNRLCKITATNHDPCMIDVFISAVRFMEGGDPKKWWEFTAERKETLKKIRSEL